jgi:hypothetical protein
MNHAKVVSEGQLLEWSLAMSESVSEKYVQSLTRGFTTLLWKFSLPVFRK